MAQSHPGRRAGVDDVAGVQRHELADVPHDVGDGEDLSAVVPSCFSSPLTQSFRPQRLRVGHLVGGHQPRAQRVERLAVLALVPRPAALDLELPLGDVVRDRVPGDMRERLLGGVQVAGRRGR